MRALYTASSGMAAQEANVELISNNIANLRTTGFKRQRAEFQDLLYQSMRRVGSTTSEAGTLLPTGVDIGSGVKLVATPRVMSQGTVAPTEKTYDLAIRGEGFFQIDLPDGRTAYSRDGSFELDATGQLVTADGYVVQPGITVPDNALSVTINSTGQVEATLQGQTAPQVLGQLQLARFVNKSGLEAMGDNLFLETAASGTPLVDNPGAEGFGTTLQAYLEQSNVNAVTEISDLISAQRAYEMNSKVISAADQMLQSTAGMLR
ncbi:flagellar basal-body rod protein FlgG [Methylopila musalis]|uniref:Flagellar basal-body rod protein FlgG n=1 Tax=Methylopila musalis TaxID=1134781 RepID=A0ABW3ZCH8_9HYPH